MYLSSLKCTHIACYFFYRLLFRLHFISSFHIISLILLLIINGSCFFIESFEGKKHNTYIYCQAQAKLEAELALCQFTCNLGWDSCNMVRGTCNMGVGTFNIGLGTYNMDWGTSRTSEENWSLASLGIPDIRVNQISKKYLLIYSIMFIPFY